MAAILSSKRSWVLSYDICDEVRELYGSESCIEIEALYGINKNTAEDQQKKECIVVSRTWALEVLLMAGMLPKDVSKLSETGFDMRIETQSTREVKKGEVDPNAYMVVVQHKRASQA